MRSRAGGARRVEKFDAPQICCGGYRGIENRAFCGIIEEITNGAPESPDGLPLTALVVVLAVAAAAIVALVVLRRRKNGPNDQTNQSK